MARFRGISPLIPRRVSPGVGFSILLVMALVLTGCGRASGNSGPGTGSVRGPGNTSGGMMGSSGMGSAGSQDSITGAGLATLVRQSEQGASINSGANTVTYEGHSPTLVALASPDGKPNMTWEIDGLVNPTVVVHPGAHVHIVLVNTDWGYRHGFELTTTSPPYPYMSMMGVTRDFFLMPLPQRTAKDLAVTSYYTRSAAFTAPTGTYHYLCPVPGHAQKGMWGKLVAA